MRFRLNIFSVGAVLFSLAAAPAFADVMPGFPDSSAPETVPVLLVGLISTAVVSGTSFLLLRRIQRSRESVGAEAAGIVQPPESTLDDSGSDLER